MSDNSPSVELAPLRGSILLDLDQFDEAIDIVQDKIVSLSDLFNIALNPHINIDMDNFNESLEAARKSIQDLENEMNNNLTNKDLDVNVITNIDTLDHYISDEELHNLFDPAETESNLDSIRSAAGEATNEVRDLESALETVASRSEETWTTAFGEAETNGADLLSKFDSALLERNEYLASAMQAEFKDSNNLFKNSEEDQDGDDSDLDPANSSGYGGGLERGPYMRRSQEHEGSSIGELGSGLLDKGMMLQWTIAPMINRADKSLIQLGFSTEAAFNLANREFGHNSEIVQQWSKNTVANLGLSSSEALNLADRFGLSARSMGANKTQAQDLAERMTSLADQLNLATGGQISLTQAGQVLTGVMGGQTYGLKQLGISFSATQQNAEAAALGYGKVYSKLTPLQQAYVNTTLLQTSLNKSLGSLHTNLNSNYGAWEKTKATLEENAEKMATDLLPAIIDLMHGVTHLVDAFSHLGKAGSLVAGSILLIATVVTPAMLIIGSLLKVVSGTYTIFKKLFGLFKRGAEVTEDLGRSTEEAAEVSRPLLDVFKTIGETILDVSKICLEWAGDIIEAVAEVVIGLDPITWAIAAIVAAVTVAAVEITKHWTTVKTFIINTLHEVEKEVSHALVSIYDFIKKTTDQVVSSVENTFKRIYSIIYNNPIVHAIGFLLFEINHLVTAALNAINKIVTAFLEFLWSWIENYFNKIVNATSNFMNYISEKVTSGLIDIKNIVVNFFTWLGSKIESIFEYMRNVIDNFFEWLGSKIMIPVNLAKNAITTLYGYIQNGISSIIGYIQNKWASFYSWFTGVLQEPIEAILNTAQAWESAGARLIESLLIGIKNAFVDVADWIGNEISNLAGDITGFSNNAASSLNKASYHGSHATGLYNVPWDGYSAELHSGEMVLTKDQADVYRSGAGAGNSGVNVTINSPKPLDAFEVKRQMEQYSRNIANGIY